MSVEVEAAVEVSAPQHMVARHLEEELGFLTFYRASILFYHS
jgi:hypothetical protein